MHTLGYYQKNKKPLAINTSDRFQHIYVLGRTGSGKSTFLKNSFLQDVYAGFGACYFDFHGQDARELLNYIPEHRVSDVIYLNPADPAGVVGFNPLDYIRPEQYSTATDCIVASLYHVFRDIGWGAQMEDLLQNSTRPLFDLHAHSQATLISISRMLTDPVYRQWVLKFCTEPAVVDFWRDEFAQWSGNNKIHDVRSSLNKLRRLHAAPEIRRTIGQPRGGVNLAHCLAASKILICDFNKATLGHKNASLLASLLFSRLMYEAENRPVPCIDDKPAHGFLKPFMVTLDEFHTVASTASAEPLSGIRKFRVGLTIAHQYTRQLLDPVLDAIDGNVGTKLLFGIGGLDAKKMHEAVGLPDTKHLTELQDYHFVAQLKQDTSTVTVRGVTAPLAFSSQGYGKAIHRRISADVATPVADIDAAYETWRENRAYILEAQPSKKEKTTVKKREPGTPDRPTPRPGKQSKRTPRPSATFRPVGAVLNQYYNRPTQT